VPLAFASTLDQAAGQWPTSGRTPAPHLGANAGRQCGRGSTGGCANLIAHSDLTWATPGGGSTVWASLARAPDLPAGCTASRGMVPSTTVPSARGQGSLHCDRTVGQPIPERLVGEPAAQFGPCTWRTGPVGWLHRAARNQWVKSAGWGGTTTPGHMLNQNASCLGLAIALEGTTRSCAFVPTSSTRIYQRGISLSYCC